MAIRPGGGHLVLVGRWQAAGAADPDPVLASLFQRDPGKVADHIGKDIGTRVANFINDLFAHGGAADQTSGVIRLGDNKAAVGKAFGNRKAHVVIVGHVLPVGKIAAGALSTAFDDVTSQRTLSQFVVVIQRPVKLVQQRAEHQCGIGNATSQHNVCTSGQCGTDRLGAEVGIHGDGEGRQWRTGIHLGNRSKLLAARIQVIAFHQRDLHLHAGGGKYFFQRLAAGLRVDPASVTDHLDALVLDLFRQRRHLLGDKVVGITLLGILHPRPGHDRQGDFGQIIKYQIVDFGLTDQLESGGIGIAPKACSAADADWRSHLVSLVSVRSGRSCPPEV